MKDSVQPVTVTVILAVLGWCLLQGFYRVTQSEWPATYISNSSGYGVVANRSFTRYALFTFVPVYLMALLASAIAQNEGGHAMVCAVTICLLHGAVHHGRVALIDIYAPNNFPVQWQWPS